MVAGQQKWLTKNTFGPLPQPEGVSFDQNCKRRGQCSARQATLLVDKLPIELTADVGTVQQDRIVCYMTCVQVF
jgi:hypothetical protein